MTKVYLTEAERDELLGIGGLATLPESHRWVIVSADDKKRLNELNESMSAIYADSQHARAVEKEPFLPLIEKLQFIMYSARREQPDISPADAISFWQKRDYQDGLGHKDLLMFLDLMTNAVVENDADIFHRFAQALSATPRKTDKERLIACLHVAFHELQEEEIPLPTKRQVKEMAVRKFAISRYVDRAIDKKTLYTVNAKGKKEFTGKSIKELQREEGLILRGNNWPDVWKASGLNKLENDRGGQPSHRKGQPAAYYRWPYPE